MERSVNALTNGNRRDMSGRKVEDLAPPPKVRPTTLNMIQRAMQRVEKGEASGEFEMKLISALRGERVVERFRLNKRGDMVLAGRDVESTPESILAALALRERMAELLNGEPETVEVVPQTPQLVGEEELVIPEFDQRVVVGGKK